MRDITKTKKEEILANGIMVAHDFLFTGSCYDKQLFVYKEKVYFYNKPGDAMYPWDNEEFLINGERSYMLSEKEIVAFSKTL